MELVNTELLFNPYNWIVVVLMLAIAVLALTYLQPYIGFASPASPAPST